LERVLHCHALIAEIGQPLHPEFILWATSASGVRTTKRSYETLETYGDTILKMASTLLAYDMLENDPRADERTINDLKNAFVTNLFLFKIG
jgi:dsRNA-specific ribonuclease